MPLTLLDFRGRVQPGNSVLLQWRTSNEINTSRFEVEQTLNGSDFKYVVAEKAVGSGDDSYSKELALPAATVYYRLKMIDVDGRSGYSSILKISGGKNQTGLIVVNNPARNELNINVTDNTLVNTGAALISSQGLIVKSLILKTGLQRIKIADLAPGVYYLRTGAGSEKIDISR